jgi:hypothetical protein
VTFKDLQKVIKSQNWKLEKLRAGNLGENNGIYGKHHTKESKSKVIETKIRNGSLGRFPEKSFTKLRIAQKLDNAGIDSQDCISSLFLDF